MAKNYPFIHKSYTLCVLCVLRGEFVQWTLCYHRTGRDDVLLFHYTAAFWSMMVRCRVLLSLSQ